VMDAVLLPDHQEAYNLLWERLTGTGDPPDVTEATAIIVAKMPENK